MSILTFSGKSQSEIIRGLIVLPMTGQMLHFYYDSLLWRFSDSHNREHVLKYIF